MPNLSGITRHKKNSIHVRPFPTFCAEACTSPSRKADVVCWHQGTDSDVEAASDSRDTGRARYGGCPTRLAQPSSLTGCSVPRSLKVATEKGL